MRGRRLIVATAVAASLAAGGTAGATSQPMLTDPTGDAIGPANVLQPLFLAPLPSDDSMDIVSGDIVAVDGALRLSTTVGDLTTDAPADWDGRRFYFALYHGGGRMTFDADFGPDYTDLTSTYYTAQTGSGYADIPFTVEFDTDTDTVTFVVDIADLNEAIDSASEGRDNLVQSGSRLHSVSAQTYYSKTLDLPFGSYPLGMFNVDAARSADDAVYELP